MNAVYGVAGLIGPNPRNLRRVERCPDRTILVLVGPALIGPHGRGPLGKRGGEDQRSGLRRRMPPSDEEVEGIRGGNLQGEGRASPAGQGHPYGAGRDLSPRNDPEKSTDGLLESVPFPHGVHGDLDHVERGETAPVPDLEDKPEGLSRINLVGQLHPRLGPHDVAPSRDTRGQHVTQQQGRHETEQVVPTVDGDHPQKDGQGNIDHASRSESNHGSSSSPGSLSFTRPHQGMGTASRMD